jgi:signal transduction histidine kinase
LLILMSLSIIFSVVIYTVTYNEIQARVGRLEESIQQYNSFANYPLKLNPETIGDMELRQSKSNLILELLYSNCVILVAGGFISYLLAQKNLQPIQKAHEAQSRFTSDASHELRTPLAVMKTEIEVALRDKDADTKTLREILSSNLEEVDKLSKLASMLLDLSRLDSGKLEFKTFNYVKAVKDVISSLKQPKNRIKFTGKNKLSIYGNETAIQDLIKILIDNALKYSPDKSVVSVGLSVKQKQSILEIKNTGQGIPPEKIEHIFDRFFRIDDSRTCCDEKSYGLGLPLAKKIIEVHNGEIIAKSTINVETVFIAKIPIGSRLKNNNKQ